MSEEETFVVDGTSAVGWVPVEGEAIRKLGAHLVRTGFLPDAASFEPVKQSSLGIVRRCKPFDAQDGHCTGLVVGYVQSGKTLSMTGVTSVAVDNGCRLVIALAGTKTNLLEQSRDRFVKDLRGAGQKWIMLDSLDGLDVAVGTMRLRNQVQLWRDDSIPEDMKEPLFITVMKHHTHLGHLADVLNAADLKGIPALVIDDEADQAGLNNAPDQPQASTTYRAIREVRDRLPNHTYLQYTATPQAPLLISLADLLSPEFAEVLEPGPGYTGGATFFRNDSPYVKTIPRDELFAAGEPPEEPPESLLDALRVFFVGAAIESARHRDGPRSMLIHPSRLTGDHGQFVHFVNAAAGEWQATLGSPPTEPDRLELVREMRGVFDELTANMDDAPEFNELFLTRLKVILTQASAVAVNSYDGGEVIWENAFAHILVGGEKLNRGYTVEGLTVTWMPRDAGGWNADTIQQRARFFGYKASYLDLCRVYLHPDVEQAYSDYVAHEEDVRKQLIQHRGRPLREWKRAFFMNPRSRPTRNNVLSDPYYRSTRLKWFQHAYPHIDEQMVEHNTRLATDFISQLSMQPHDSFPQHEAAIIPLAALMELLLEWEVRATSDVVGLYAIRCWVQDLLDQDEDAVCELIRMNGGDERGRTEDAHGRVQLFEGRRSSGDAYPGDRALAGSNYVAAQLHTLTVKDRTTGEPTAGVPALAVYVPEDMRGQHVVVQPGSNA